MPQNLTTKDQTTKAFYLACAIAGAFVPYSQLVPWLYQHGFDLKGLLTELFSTRIGAFFGLDVLIAAIAVFGFIAWEGRRMRMKKLWLPVAATGLVGVSCGLPLFLYMREHASGKQDSTDKQGSR